MGAVTSATFTKPLAIFLPRQWDHELYIQDDWKVSPTLSLNLGLRWTYSSPYKTKYDQQSQFDPTVIDPVTGLMGAITHPTGVDRQARLEQLPAAARPGLELPPEVGVPVLVWRHDRG